MKKKRFLIEQIVAVLKQADLGMPVADLIRQVAISEQTFYRWKQQYAGMQSEVARPALKRETVDYMAATMDDVAYRYVCIRAQEYFE